MGTVVKLSFGVYDIPYSHQREEIKEKKKNLRSKKGRKQEALNAGAGGITTGDVAEFLEREYHVFETFHEMHETENVADIEACLEAALENAIVGGPVTADVFAKAGTDIGARFKQFLSNSEIESYPGAEAAGIPTIASGKTPYRRGGINHRLKHPYSHKNPPRPSFIDTGLYQASSVVEVKNDDTDVDAGRR